MKRLLKIVLWAVLVLVVLVALGPTILSTSLGRWLLESRLQSELGRDVSVGRLEVGWLSGFALEDLQVGERAGFGDKPFLRIGSLGFPNSPLALLSPEEPLKAASLERLELSLVRLPDGRLSIDDLTEKKPHEPREEKRDESGPSVAGTLGWTIPVRVSEVSVRYDDRKSGTIVTLEKLSLSALYDKGRLDVTEGTGTLNGGQLTFSGSAELAARPETFELTARVDDAEASSQLSGLAGYLAPLLYNPHGSVSGRWSLDLALSGKGFEKAAMESDLTGKSSLEVRDLAVVGSELMQKIVGLAQKALGEERQAMVFDQLTADSRIGDGRVASDVRASRKDDFAVLMAGHTDFGGAMRYRVSFEGKKIEKYLGQWKELAGFLLVGTLQKPRVDYALPGSETGLLDSILDMIEKSRK